MATGVQYLMCCAVLVYILQTVSCSLNEACFCESTPICRNMTFTSATQRFFCSNKSIESLQFENSVFWKTSIFSNDSSVEHLKELKIFNSSLKEIHGNALEKLTHLETFDLTGSYNPDIFGLDLSNTSLKVLTLSHCNLESSDVSSLNKLLLHTPHLKRLILSGNHLEKLDDLSFSKVNLEELDLSGNSLTALPSQFFEGLQTLRLQGVELICNCSWMKGISAETSLEPIDLMCKNPVDPISVNEFVSKCQSVEEAPNSSLIVVVVILVLVLLAAVIGCFAHRIVTNRKRRSQEKKAVRYSAVYRETVETSAPSSRTTMETKA